jgi:hypothetical protein
MVRPLVSQEAVMENLARKFWRRWVGRMDDYDRGALAALGGSSLWAGVCAMCAPAPWVYFAGAVVAIVAHVVFSCCDWDGW